MKSRFSFEPHLTLNEAKVPMGWEWRPQLNGWCFLRIRSGVTYWQEASQTQELPPGACLAIGAKSRGTFRASQLNDAMLDHFFLDPAKLSGLLSLSEQQALKAADASQVLARIFPPSHPVSDQFKTILKAGKRPPATIRLQLLQLFLDLFETEIERRPTAGQVAMDSRERLKQMLDRMTASEFLESSLAELAPKISCSPRHLSRLFQLEMGTSFREKQTELRLERACELLANSDAKVVDVALTSGYPSNSLFSLVFKKRFGVSPGEWRQQQTKKKPGRSKSSRMQPV